ncbi:hypothetical protein HSX11_02185 [Oxalobacteraceae bacterium]|nr:hypothetical protein [Oxalobacteraceae bacterium]
MTIYTFEIDLSRGSTRPAYQVSGADTLFLLNTMPDVLLGGDQIQFRFNTHPDRETAPGMAYSLTLPLLMAVRPVQGTVRHSPFVEAPRADADRVNPQGGSAAFYDFDYWLGGEMSASPSGPSPVLTVAAGAGSWRFALWGSSRPRGLGGSPEADIPFLVDLRCELTVGGIKLA